MSTETDRLKTAAIWSSIICFILGAMVFSALFNTIGVAIGMWLWVKYDVKWPAILNGALLVLWSISWFFLMLTGY